MQLLHDKFIFLNWAKNIMPFHTFVAAIFYDKKTIVDNNSLYSNYIPTIFYYLSCKDRVLIKYILLFKLSNSNFYLRQIKDVGHD